MSQELPGHHVEEIVPGISMGFFRPEYRDVMDQALEEWEKHKAKIRQHTPDFATEGEVRSFAYWLFRWSGLIQIGGGNG